MIADRERGSLAKILIAESCAKQEISPTQLTIHSDRGPSMTSEPVALLLATLGVTKSLSRPQVSNDNPYSESQFKTMKYQPEFPARFGSIQDARVFCRRFFDWYNNEHYHSGIALLTPAIVHSGRAQECNSRRQEVLDRAYETNPNRFVKAAPQVQQLPEAVWINPPERKQDSFCATTNSGTVIGTVR